MIRKPKSKKTAKRKVLKTSKSFRRNPDEFEDSPRFNKKQHAELIKHLWEYLEYNRKSNSGENQNDIALAINNFFQKELKHEFEAENSYFEFDYMLDAAKSLVIKLEKIINDFEKGKPIKIPKYTLRFE